MNIVYKITFTNRKKENKYPFYYIGSKSNCHFINNTIVNKKGKSYYGSSKYKEYNKIVKDNIHDIHIEILYDSTDYKNVLKKEKELHILYDVVMSPEYFNQSIALTTNFHNPNYACMKNVQTDKICRILKNHPDIERGLWIGMTKGRKWYNNGEINKLLDHQPIGWNCGRLGDWSGKNNSFFGKKHDKEKLKKGVKTRFDNGSYKAWNKGTTGLYMHSDETKIKMSKSRKGTKCGDKNPMFNKKFINNGIINKVISKGDIPPDGWKFGQLK